ncbi:RNase P modulator RnpM [Candidatus Formimonas warabiya]|uniref:Nucleic acid-binding protein n=1 Tax=Formimonas warabiya TaxID=1761012 RepID=A0A3G1KP04_FORW1|nr:YlxR family protein [Candidatus Formimonas warabiya]ATW24203.1 nucleic acid-binding protein [Candidatus Formimonas warabiya]
MIRVKKIPQRMCVGCKEMKNKKSLIRVVKTPEEMVLIDVTGKKAGRGAYVCPNADCLQLAIKSKGLEKSLKTKISPDIYATLKEQLPKEPLPLNEP